MTHCDFSARSAREEMRHIIGSSVPFVIIGPDKDQNRGCKKKDKDHMEFLCESYEVQAACGRHFVHELTSEVNFRMRCVTRIMVNARNENNSGGLAHVGVGCKRECTGVLVRTTQARKWNKQEHRTEWCADTSWYRCMRCDRSSKHKKMQGTCTGPKYLSKTLERCRKRHVGGHDMVRRMDKQGEVLAMREKERDQH